MCSTISQAALGGWRLQNRNIHGKAHIHQWARVGHTLGITIDVHQKRAPTAIPVAWGGRHDRLVFERRPQLVQDAQLLVRRQLPNAYQSTIDKRPICVVAVACWCTEVIDRKNALGLAA